MCDAVQSVIKLLTFERNFCSKFHVSAERRDVILCLYIGNRPPVSYCGVFKLRNCTYSNYTEAAAICSAAQQHSTFSVQILYKLYSLQLNCTYSNYTEAAVICSAAQQHSTISVQILYKLYKLYIITQKLPLYVQLHNSTQTLQLMSCDVQCGRLISIIYIYQYIQLSR